MSNAQFLEKTGSQQELNQGVQKIEGREEQFRAERRNSQLLREGQITFICEFVSFLGKKRKSINI